MERLQELGWVEGRNLVIENRQMGPEREKLAAAAKELVGLRVDLIITGGGAETPQIAMSATKTIPILFFMADDPVRTGLVRNLSRPDGNVTGFSSMNADLDAKRLELLREALPALKRVGVMWSPIDPSGAAVMAAIENAARSLNILLEPLPINRADELPDAFADAKKRAVEAVMVLGTPILFPHQRRVAELAAAAGLPTISAWKSLPEAGGLLSYGTDLPAANRRIAEMVDKILKGAKPADVPVERPTKFELVVNKKSANALGLKIPQQLLLRADRLIE
jgi:putative ABC transport system substrate-binding protein